MNKPTNTQIVNAAKNESGEKLQTDEASIAQLLKLIEANHDIQSVLGNWDPDKHGILGSIKNRIQRLIAGSAISATRHSFRKQEKFNKLVLETLTRLAKQSE